MINLYEVYIGDSNKWCQREIRVMATSLERAHAIARGTLAVGEFIAQIDMREFNIKYFDKDAVIQEISNA